MRGIPNGTTSGVLPTELELDMVCSGIREWPVLPRVKIMKEPGNKVEKDEIINQRSETERSSFTPLFLTSRKIRRCHTSPGFLMGASPSPSRS